MKIVTIIRRNGSVVTDKKKMEQNMGLKLKEHVCRVCRNAIAQAEHKVIVSFHWISRGTKWRREKCIPRYGSGVFAICDIKRRADSCKGCSKSLES